MSRTGIEPKPPWETVPPEVRRAVDEALGAPVKRGVRVWGGYGPSPTFRLRLADGRRAFFKGVWPDSNEVARAAHAREERIYRDLGALIGPWAPGFYGALQVNSWQVILLEDLGPKVVLPGHPVWRAAWLSLSRGSICRPDRSLFPIGFPTTSVSS